MTEQEVNVNAFEIVGISLAKDDHWAGGGYQTFDELRM